MTFVTKLPGVSKTPKVTYVFKTCPKYLLVYLGVQGVYYEGLITKRVVPKPILNLSSVKFEPHTNDTKRLIHVLIEVKR